jgi:hypothetical protein
LDTNEIFEFAENAQRRMSNYSIKCQRARADIVFMLL